MRDLLREKFGVTPEILAGLLVFVMLLWGFVEIADEIAEPGGVGVDRRILLALRDAADPADPIGPHWVEEAMRDLTALGSMVIVTLVTVTVVGYLALQQRLRSAIFLVVAVVGGVVIGAFLKGVFDRPRPDVVPHMVEVLSESFPSGHTIISSIVYPILGVMVSRTVRRTRTRVYLLAVAIGLALLVGLTRVYLGVHYPTDVLGGWALGFAWALLCWMAVRWLQRHRTVEPEPPPQHGASASSP